GDLARRLARLAGAVVDVGEDVVAEGCDVGIGLGQEALARPLLGPRQVARVQERLGEVQLARAEVGLQLRYRLEMPDRFAEAAACAGSAFPMKTSASCSSTRPFRGSRARARSKPTLASSSRPSSL